MEYLDNYSPEENQAQTLIKIANDVEEIKKMFSDFLKHYHHYEGQK